MKKKEVNKIRNANKGGDLETDDTLVWDLSPFDFEDHMGEFESK